MLNLLGGELDAKTVITQAAYFLLLQIILETLFCSILLCLSYVTLSDFSPETAPLHFTRTTFLRAFLWGMLRSLKTKYLSIKKAPLFLISVLFILSATCSEQGPFYTSQDFSTATNEVNWSTLPTTSRWIAAFNIICAIPLFVLMAIIAFFPTWIMLRSGYILTKIYFKKPQP